MKVKLMNNKHILFKSGIIAIIIVVCFGLYNTIDQILKHTSIDHVSAENFACSDAGFHSEDVMVLSNDYVKENGKYVYRISFVNSDNQFNYVINGKDGSIIEKSQSKSNVIYNKEKSYFEKKINIDIEEAKRIASDYYGIKNKDALVYTRAKLDDEKNLVYSIIMNDNEKEYNTKVSATTGDVLFSQVRENGKKQDNKVISEQVNTNPDAANGNITVDTDRQTQIVPAPAKKDPPSDDVTDQDQTQIDNDDNDDDDVDDDDDDVDDDDDDEDDDDDD